MKKLVLSLGLIIIALGIYLFTDYYFQNRKTNSHRYTQSPLKVDIYGKQFKWIFHYPGNDGFFGSTSGALITEENEIGLDPNDHWSKDDIIAYEFVVPTNAKLETTLTSLDLIHATIETPIHGKHDAIPGFKIPMESTTPLESISGEFACSQLCGKGHNDMTTTYSVVSYEEFEEWMNKQLKKRKKVESAENGTK